MCTLHEILMDVYNSVSFTKQANYKAADTFTQKVFKKVSYLQNKFLINVAFCNAGLKVWIL